MTDIRVITDAQYIQELQRQVDILGAVVVVLLLIILVLFIRLSVELEERNLRSRR